MNKIIFLLMISAQLLNAQSLKDLQFGTDSTFEVVSWNIEWFPKNEQVTADSVKTILQSLAADVYALRQLTLVFVTSNGQSLLQSPTHLYPL